MKNKLLLILLYILTNEVVFSFDLIPIDCSFINKNLTQEDLYTPGVYDLLNGKGFYLSIGKKINYIGVNVTMMIYCNINTAIIPYHLNSLKILKVISSDDKIWKSDNVVKENHIIFDDLPRTNSFTDDYKPRGLTYLPSYKPDILYGRDGTRIERDYSRGFWEETGAEDRLTYYFKGNRGLYSDYIIEFYGIWDAFWDVHDDSLLTPKLKDFDPPDGGQYIQELFTMTNAELAAYPDQDDPAIRLMHLLNESMATFRFTEDPNAPPANLALVNDDRVRIRSGYSLEGEILGHGNRGEEVIVMERSPERQTIGGQTDYWYKIVSKRSFTKGWMFGPFLDFRE